MRFRSDRRPPALRPGIVLASLAALLACVPATTGGRTAGRPRLPAGIGADSISLTVLAPGVRHTQLRHEAGPWAVHILEVDPARCGIAFRTAKGGGRVVGRETTSALAGKTETALGRPVLAAVNADFFSFDPPGRPEGAQVAAGEIVKSDVRERRALGSDEFGPAPAFGVDGRGRPFIASVRFRASARARGARIPIARVNAADSAVVLYNRWFGEATPDSAAVEVVVGVIAPAVPGDTAAGVVVAVDTAAAGVPFSDDRVVLAGAAPALGALEPGDTVRWILAFDSAPARVHELIGGFPALLRDGAAVHATEFVMPASFSQQRHPRTAVGWGEEGTILLVVVDGRQSGYSEGMTLDELTAYMRALGATQALNLDGGGSTTLVTRGRVANRPSDEAGERPVANALLVLGPAPGECAA